MHIYLEVKAVLDRFKSNVINCLKVLPLKLRERLIGDAQSNIKLTLHNTINKTIGMLD